MSEPFRIVIVTDSLGMPRPGMEPDTVWVSRLAGEMRGRPDITVTQFVQRSRTMPAVEGMLTDLFLYRPDLLVIQVGIVDCVRRALPRWFLAVVSRLPGISAAVRTLSSRHHFSLTRLMDLRKVREPRFRKAAAAVVAAGERQKCSVCLLAIAPPGPALSRKVYRASEDIALYNAALAHCAAASPAARFLDPFGSRDPARCTAEEDGHHLSAEGHELVLSAVRSEVESCLRGRGGRGGETP